MPVDSATLQNLIATARTACRNKREIDLSLALSLHNLIVYCAENDEDYHDIILKQVGCEHYERLVKKYILYSLVRRLDDVDIEVEISFKSIEMSSYEALVIFLDQGKELDQAFESELVPLLKTFSTEQREGLWLEIEYAVRLAITATLPPKSTPRKKANNIPRQNIIRECFEIVRMLDSPDNTNRLGIAMSTPEGRWSLYRTMHEAMGKKDYRDMVGYMIQGNIIRDHPVVIEDDPPVVQPPIDDRMETEPDSESSSTSSRKRGRESDENEAIDDLTHLTVRDEVVDVDELQLEEEAEDDVEEIVKEKKIRHIKKKRTDGNYRGRYEKRVEEEDEHSSLYYMEPGEGEESDRTIDYGCEHCARFDEGRHMIMGQWQQVEPNLDEEQLRRMLEIVEVALF